MDIRIKKIRKCFNVLQQESMRVAQNTNIFIIELNKSIRTKKKHFFCIKSRSTCKYLNTNICIKFFFFLYFKYISTTVGKTI